FGQDLTFDYYVDGNGDNAATISTVNSTSNPSLNRTRILSWFPYTPLVDGQFKVTYDDPDGGGPRVARQDVFTYDTSGRLVQMGVGPVGSPSHLTTISYNTAAGEDSRVASVAYPDGSSRTLDLTRQRNA